MNRITATKIALASRTTSEFLGALKAQQRREYEQFLAWKRPQPAAPRKPKPRLSRKPALTVAERLAVIGNPGVVHYRDFPSALTVR
jgi:hypothetical protein